MAVPKNKKSISRTKMHRNHLSLKPVNVGINKTTGEYQLSHHISLDGYYNGSQVIVKKAKKKRDNG